MSDAIANKFYMDSPAITGDGKTSDSNERPDEIDQKKRKHILNEIYETEKTYQHQLKLLTTIFLEPVKFSAILAPQIIDGVFSNIEAIHSVSISLLKLMEERGVVDSLLELAPYMKLYSTYANNFNTSAKLLEELQNRSDDFKRLLKFQESREEMESLKLNSLLLTPIQRVPRYRLLLENLLEKTRNDDPNLPKLKGAYEEIAKVTSHINECVRQHENFNKMLDIQNCFTGVNAPQVLAPGRFFIRQGPVLKITKKGKAKERTLFLFNDLLVCAKKESYMYQCIDVYTLFNCIVEQLLGSSDNGNGLFKVICGIKFLLLCSKEGEKPWFMEIKEAITKVHENFSSLKRGRASFVLSARSYESLKTKAKPKVMTPRKAVHSRAVNSRMLDFNGNGNSPVLNGISNRPSKKRNTVLIAPAISVFDICSNSGGMDLINTSLNNISSFLKNNSFLFDATESDEQGEPLNGRTLEEIPYSPKGNYIQSGNWTVTERVAAIEKQKTDPSSELKISCAGKRKDDGDETFPYMKKTKYDEEVPSLSSSGIHEVTSTPLAKKPVSNNSQANCSLM